MTNLGKAVPLMRPHVSMQMEWPQDGLGEVFGRRRLGRSCPGQRKIAKNRRIMMREPWIFEARLAYQKTCPSALRAFIFILMLLLVRQPRNNCADCAKRRSNIV